MIIYRDNPSTGGFKPAERQEFFVPLVAAMKEKTVWLAGIAWIPTTLAWVVLAIFWPTYANLIEGIPLVQVGLVMALLPVGAALGCLLGPMIARAIGYDKPVIWPWGIILVVLDLLTLKVTSLGLIAVIFFIIGFGGWMWIPLLLTTIYHLPKLSPRAVSLGISIILVLTQLGGYLGAVNIGAAAPTYGLGKVMEWSFVTPLLFTVLTLFIPETGRIATEKKAAAAKAAQQAG